MLCDDCLSLIREADQAVHSIDASKSIKREVTTTAFQEAIDGKCYLCTRLLVQLGSEKWQHILDELPETNLVTFDKSVEFDCSVISIRLGCKLTPILLKDEIGVHTALGKGYSYGWLQVALLPLSQRPLILPDIAIAAKDATSTSDKRAFELISHWLQDCMSSPDHDSCRYMADEPRVYPTRLIEVTPNGAHDQWRLTEDNESRVGPYFTLSHRWGSGTIKLDRTTHKDMLKGMPISVLPTTYQDAIKVTRYLKARYLWIDSICVFQDERLDIQKEAMKMASVFGNALCNISALTATDDGLFCTRSTETMNSDAPLLPCDRYGLKESYLINDLQLWPGELLHMPLTKRGWVLQEEVLAPRTIYFGTRQVLWDCVKARACETYPLMLLRETSVLTRQPETFQLPPHLHSKEKLLCDDALGPIAELVRSMKAAVRKRNVAKLTAHPQSAMRDPTEIFQDWTRFISHYSLRRLTFPADKLLAIAGIARLFGEIMATDLTAGILISHLMEGLLWFVRKNTLTMRPDYRAPSWSWASCEGFIIYAEPFNLSWTVAQALEVPRTRLTGQGVGEGKFDPLKLQAYCLEMQIDERGEWTASRGGRKVPHLIVRLDCNEDVTHLNGIFGAVVRTTAFRLTDNTESSNPSWTSSFSGSTSTGKVKGKIHLAAQGIMVTSTSTNTRSPSLPHSVAIDTLGTSGEHQYRRIGYFSVEDRKSGSLTPKWVIPGCTLFSELAKETQNRVDFTPFDFEAQQEFLTTFEII